MQRRVEVLRFKAGQRTTAPPPEVFWERAPAGVPEEAGEELLILVDLEPYIPHRAREVRTIAEETYWTTSGSITARMRRAIADANRYLVLHNAEVIADLRTFGSISLIAFLGEETFIGQAGPGNTLIHYPQQRLMELFPKPGRSMTPIGVAVPPIIHISYATLEPGCQVVLLTNSIMQTRLVPAWENLLAEQAAAPEQDVFAQDLAQKQVSGGAIHVLCLADEEEEPARPAARKKIHLPWPPQGTKRAAVKEGQSAFKPQPPHAVPLPRAEETPPPPPETPSPEPVKPLTLGAGVLASLWQRIRPARPAAEMEAEEENEENTEETVISTAEPTIPSPRAVDERPAASPRAVEAYPSAVAATPMGETPAPDEAAAWEEESPHGLGARLRDTLVRLRPSAQSSAPPDTAPIPEETGDEEETRPGLGERLRDVWARRRASAAEEDALPTSANGAARPVPRPKAPRAARRPLAQRAGHVIQKSLRPLLPGRTPRPRTSAPRPVPAETRWLPWLALGLFLLALLTTGLTYAEMGGAQRAQQLLSKAEEARTLAYTQQTPDSWRQVQSLANTVLVLDANNKRARELYDEATLALDALQKAALLALQPLRELGSSPQPRRLIATKDTLYLLDPGTDSVQALDAREPGAARTLLKRGQSLNGMTVPHLVDIAWMNAVSDFPDGALFIYGEGGTLYIYEPTAGPEAITQQRLEGNLPPGSVTMFSLWGTRLYVVQRQSNELLRYQPLNGLYNTQPRPYFAPALTPPLQNVVGMALDGRLYLLFGDGTLRAYYEGAEDPSFKVEGLPEANFKASMLALDPDPAGPIYLADPRQEFIVVLDRRGAFRHQFRLPGHLGRTLETLCVTPDGKQVYLVAENKLYLAPLPDFAQ